MAVQKKKAVSKKAAPKGRASIYKGTDANAKGGNKKIGSGSGQPAVDRGLARANAAASEMRRAAKGKGLRGQVTVKKEISVDEGAYGPGKGRRRYIEFAGGGGYMGGASLKNTLTKAPKDARRAK